MKNSMTNSVLNSEAPTTPAHDDHKQSWFDYLRNKNNPRVINGVVLAASISLLTACGGGGGGGSTPAAAPTSNTPTTSTGTTTTPPPTDTGTTTPPADEETPQPTPDPTSLDDLVVDPDFTMQAVFDLAVNVNLADSKRGYFSLCDDFSQGAEISVNYESCLLRGSLNQGQLNETLQVANHQQQLMAVVWFYDGSAPQYQVWHYNNQQDEQVLTFN